MSSALPPILPADPPARHAPAPEDTPDPGAFERALGLATMSQTPIRPAPPTEAPHASVSDEEHPARELHSSLTEVLAHSLPSQEGALASSPAPPRGPLTVATGSPRERTAVLPEQGSEPDPGRAASAAPDEPVAIPGRPLTAPPLPAIEGERQARPALTSPRVATPLPHAPVADAPDAGADARSIAARGSSANGRHAPHAEPRSGTIAPLPAENGAARPQAPRSDSLPESGPALPGPRAALAAASRAAGSVSPAAPSGLPAALALDVRVIASRIAPVMRRGGLIDSEPRPAERPVAASAVPAPAAASDSEPLAPRSAPEDALASLATRDGAQRSPALPPSPTVREEAPIVRMPAAAVPSSAMRLATPQEPALPVRMAEAAASILAAERRKGESERAPAASASGAEAASQESSARRPGRQAPGVVRAADPHQPTSRGDSQSNASMEANAPRREGTPAARQEPPEAKRPAEIPVTRTQPSVAEARRDADASRPARAEGGAPPASSTPATANASNPAAAAADAPAVPVAVDGSPAPASARSAGAIATNGSGVPNTESGAAERAEAALAARLSPERRAADRVTLRFEGEGGLEGRLRVSVRGDQVSARILSEDSGTLERLGGELKSLQRALEGQGFRDSRVSIQDLRTSGAAEPRPEARPGEDRRQGEPGRRQTGEERRGDPGPDGQRNRRGAREGRQGT